MKEYHSIEVFAALSKLGTIRCLPSARYIRSQKGSVQNPSARLCLLVFAIVLFVALTLVVYPTFCQFNSSFVMGKARCCSCQTVRGNTCNNCDCVKSGRSCTTCRLSRDGNCTNRYGCGEVVAIVEKLECPFVDCTAGVNGKRSVIRRHEMSRFRSHPIIMCHPI